MKAISLQQPREFRMVDIDEPERPGPGEALVRVHRVGICGTDISGYLGKFPFYSYPRIPGHELGVEVVDVGSDVERVKIGDRCSVEPYLNDEQSFSSVRKRPNCCEQLQVLGVHVDGGLRPHFKLPARKLHPSASLAMDQLALVETLAIGCHAVNRAVLQPGENILVIGAGPIGLSVIQFARLKGVNVTVMDLNAQRLAFCRETMGVDHTIQVQGGDQDLEALQQVTDGNLATAVFDATGNVRSMCGAFEYVGFTGRIVFVGITTEHVSFHQPLVHRREMTILASRNAVADEFRYIIDLIEQGTIDTRPWITHRIGFAELIDQFEDLIKPETNAIKAIVEVS